MSVQKSQVNMLDNSQYNLKQANTHNQQVTKVVLVQFLHCLLLESKDYQAAIIKVEFGV